MRSLLTLGRVSRDEICQRNRIACDKNPPVLMWRATCEVMAKNVGTDNFAYDCDT
jgi:hypothetical protein